MASARAPDLRRVASSAGVQLVGKAAIALMGVAAVAILTRALGTEGYGRYALALAYVQAFAVLADVGLFAILVRELGRSPERAKELVGATVVLRAALWAAVAALACAVSFLAPYDADTRAAIALAALPLGLGLLTQGLAALPQARLRMSGPVLADVAGRAASLTGAVVVSAAGLGVQAALLAAALGQLVALAGTAVASARLAPIDLRVAPRLWRDLLRMSLPLGLALGLNELYFRADTLIISLSREVEEVGAYALAFRVVELVGANASVLLVSVLPLLSAQVAARAPEVRATLQAATDALVVLGLGVAAGGVVLAEPIATALGGDEFADAADPLRLLVLAGALSLLNGLFGVALVARDRQRDTLWLNVAALIANVGLNVALVPRYGIVAAAAVAIACEAGLLLASRVLVRRHLALWPSFSMLLRAGPAAALMAGALVLALGLPLAAELAIGSAVYLAALAATGALSRLRTALRPAS